MRRGNQLLLGILSYLEPVASLLLACAYFGIAPGASLLVGCALVVAGALICRAGMRE
jgi:drug/metabolite transporter (DMT)-like permease